MGGEVPRYSELINRPMDNTALAMYMSCPRKFYYGMILNRRSEGAPTPALAYGSGWHVAMETHYSAPMMAREELYELVEERLADRWQVSSNPDDYLTFQRCMVEYDKYVSTYGLPWQEEAKTVGWPDQPLVEIAVELPIPGARHPYTGKIDRIVQINGQYLVQDHKTASQMRADYFKQWHLDNQMIGYAALAQQVTGLPIAGVNINLHVVRKSDSEFKRETPQFVESRIQDWHRNYDYWLARIENDLLELDQGDAASAFPHNFAACAGKYGMCQYSTVCSMPPKARQASLEADFTETPWNPLEAAEEGVE